MRSATPYWPISLQISGRTIPTVGSSVRNTDLKTKRRIDVLTFFCALYLDEQIFPSGNRIALLPVTGQLFTPEERPSEINHRKLAVEKLVAIAGIVVRRS